MDFISLVNRYFQTLTAQEREIIGYLQQVQDYSGLTAQSLADACFVSRATISRLIKKLELDGFAELKFLLKNFRQESNTTLEKTSVFEEVVQSYHMYIDQIFEKLDLKNIVNLLLETDVLYLYGTGNEQKLEVETMRHVFTALGKRVVVFFDKGEYDYAKECFKENDLLVLFSYKGESPEGIAILKDSQLYQLKRLVFTQTSQNTMAQLADYRLYVPTESVQTPTRLTYEVSTTFYFIIDQLFFDYKQAIGGSYDTPR
ncbi:MurR/RpiR family transcriptional regulator [Streptococcus sp. S784/96/1]|uniref:MurR/RpiR family transcriptional regulator n=1 Tax=Streptococcus sp. S784/96/1 TaxID=2653499 RepID=UPI001386E3BB|nr:MurR/RpiR family transcriptional regulator [Streptococcus sp. S784/96/1]